MRVQEETLALVAQALWGTFHAARYLKHNGWPLKDAVQLLARRPS